jgi:Ricin-type beta-trefoil lectin domain
LFATDNTDNAFTATEEVLIEDANTVAAEPSKNISNTSTVSSISSSQVSTISSQTVPTISPIENLDFPVAKEKTSWLQDILSFGSISAIAQVTQQYNYSWPWKGGDQYLVIQGWHECESISKNTLGISQNFVGKVTGCSLDFRPASNATSSEIIAPITSTITRSCIDTKQGTYQIGTMVIGHLDKNTMSLDTGAFVRKSQKLGNIWQPQLGGDSDSCGQSAEKHIHIKFAQITNPNPINLNQYGFIDSYNDQYQSLIGSLNIDGKILQGPKLTPIRYDNKQNYNPFILSNGTIDPINSTFITSQNYPNTNTYTGKIKSFTTPNKIFDIYDFNGNNGAYVQLFEAGTNNPVNQRWSFDNVNQQIKGMNGKCLEVGTNNYIKMQDCTTSIYQKWGFSINNQIISEANNYCVVAVNGIVSGSLLAVSTCSSTNNNQKWNFADIVTLVSSQTKLNVRFNLSGPWNNTTKLMNKDLNTNNKIPLNQPYCTAPWNYCGTENIPDRTKIDQTAVDWVLIEIKNATGATVQRKAALITSDAYLTDAAGINNPGSFYPIILDNVTTTGSYKIIVRHRNHLAIATNANITLTPGVTTTVDFTKNVNVKGDNQKLIGTNSLGANIYGLRVGDVNGDGAIDAIDRSLTGDAGEGTYYSNYDLNLNSDVDALDRSIINSAPESQASL